MLTLPFVRPSYWPLDGLLHKGIRLNNPGNIRQGQNWIGEAKVSLDPAFETYEHPSYGYRAMIMIYKSYSRRSLKTIEQCIFAWAPPHENATDSYVDFVCKYAFINEQMVLLDLPRTQLIQFLHAQTIIENGRVPNHPDATWFSEEVVNDGIEMALAAK